MTAQVTNAVTQTKGTSGSEAKVVTTDTLEIINKEIDRVNNLFIGLVIFIAVTFIVEIVMMNYDRIKDKDLYLNYNELVERFMEKDTELQLKIQEQDFEIRQLKEEIPGLQNKK